ncbi:MAG: GMC oxidoreductase [Casimicrobiaceae bacterium]
MPSLPPLDIVLGSGHAGVGAASALVARGRRVLLLDAGEDIDPASARLRDRLGAVEPPQWDPADVDALVAPRRRERSDTMRPYGSGHLFRRPAGMPPWTEDGSAHRLQPSFATGGLSNAWGASVLPYRDADLDDWPLAAVDLAPHYAAVAPLLHIRARDDDLAAAFPLYGALPADALPLSSQASEVLDRLQARRGTLRRLGVVAGQSRQAIAAPCRLCALCLHGCPYRLIFNAADVVGALAAGGGLIHAPGVVAVRFTEEHDGVRIATRDARTGEPGEFFGARLYVAAGVIPTALLVLDSIDRPGERVLLQDTQHLYLPLLHGWRAPVDPAREPRHALAQIFMEIEDPHVSRHTAHVQLYTHNDTFAPDMRLRFGRMAPALERMVQQLSRRLIVAQAFLHSRESPAIAVRLQRGAGGARLAFEVVANETSAGVLARVKRRVARVALLAGLAPLLPLARAGLPGSSFHCGGTFPMRRSPVGLETDLLGRLPGLQRVHLVDASVFPSIPATTIAFSAMANAHRIAAAAAGLDG